MGFHNREAGKFVTVFGGKFSEKAEANTPGAVARTNKLGKVVYEKYHDSFTGKLQSIKVKDGEYGKQWVFGFKDSQDTYLLQLPYSNSYAKNILKMLPNADLTKEMRLTPQVKMVDGKNRSSLFINQGDSALKHAYTRENPNGLPPMEEITVKGTKVWDDTKQMEFLEKMAMETIVPKLEWSDSIVQQNEPAKAIEYPADEINPEDVPF